ncbi:MAG: hypothetical protein JWM85_563, partial [Acidimicrobiaceae bacterium]|nr:hypothetical protein [Acidimicrobiaceae bacterium]
MTDPWNFAGEPTVNNLECASLTLVEGTTFSIASASGDIEPGGVEGLFFEDTRFVSTWRVRLDEAPSQGLAVINTNPFSATFVSRGRPKVGEADSTLLLQRTRYVGNGMREDVAVRNLGREAAACSLTFELDADFAHIFEVKENRVQERGRRSVWVDRSLMSFAYSYREVSRRVDVVFPDQARLTAGSAVLEVVVPPGEEWQTSFEFHLSVDGDPIELRYAGADPEQHSGPMERLRAWQERTPRVRTGDRALDEAFLRSEQDLGALQIVDPQHVDRSVIAAGAPWFMTLFGRDSLITSIMTLDVDPNLATGTLLTLARMQGIHVDPLTEEEPGKILHEVRRGLATAANTRAGSIYYGSVDSTPLFVVALGELNRWGAPELVIKELLPHADRALAWIDEYGDRDGDGFVEYQRATGRGLVNQGWKDSFDGVSFAEGRLAEAPIALCEVQGYVYAGFIARAEIADRLGDESGAKDFRDRAARLKAAFNERFWLADRGYFALGLDGEKRQIDSLS